MSYIGNSPISQAFVTDQFSGTGSQTAFTMSVAPANTASCIVAVSGVLQDPSTYSVSGTTLTFSVAPPTGTGNISVRYLGIPASGVTTTAYRTVTEFTATASQTTFTPPSYTVGFLNVYRNGVLLGSADYTATNGTTVVLATGCVVGDLVTTESFLVSSVLNAIPNTTGSISSSNLPAGLTITSPTIATSAALPANTTLNSLNLTPYTMKNRIINGGMVIDQRNAGASVTAADGVYTLDRWITYTSQPSKFTVQQNAGSITPPSGYTNYLGITSSSSYSAVSSDYFGLAQFIEGYNVADLAWGTANAKTVTLSFQVYSSLTGTFSVALTNSAGNRSYLATYTISSANTWTQISVTIVGDTSGTWVTNNGKGIRVWFDLGSGSSYNGTAGSWGAATITRTSGSQSIIGTNGATWYITGVQLEVGSYATPFEWRPYGTELALCYRYYYKLNAAGQQGYYTVFGSGKAYGTSAVNIVIPLPVSMRTYPTVLDTSAMSTFQYETGNSAGNTPTSLLYNPNTNQNNMAAIEISKSAAFTNGAYYFLQAYNNATAYLGIGAEL